MLACGRSLLARCLLDMARHISRTLNVYANDVSNLFSCNFMDVVVYFIEVMLSGDEATICVISLPHAG